MKTAADPRHQRRIALMQKIFTLSFQPDTNDEDVQKFVSVQPEVDTQIQKAAPEWPLDKISKIDLAILRLALFELTVQKSEPPKVIIDEAVELAKSYGNPASPSFINGVLGTIVKDLNIVT